MFSRDSWFDKAACKGQPSQPWFPSRNSPGYVSAYALSFCCECPVKVECLTYAIAHFEAEGVWGGTSGRARRAARRFCVACQGRLTPREVAVNLLAKTPLARCERCRAGRAQQVDITDATRETAREAALRSRQRWAPTEGRPVARSVAGYDSDWLSWLDERRQ